MLARDPRGIVEGARVTLRIMKGPVPITWVAKHVDVQSGRGFSDVQDRGPFRAWRHERRFEDTTAGAVLDEEIAATLPFGPLGALAAPAVRRSLSAMLRWRHAVLAHDLEQRMTTPLTPQRIAITGASGFIASVLIPMLTTEGHTVVPISRGAGTDGIQWDPERGTLDPAALEGIDAIIHLAGAGIADRRWTSARKRELRASRTKPTALLARTIASLREPPRVLISMSAVGIYGDAGDSVLTEDTPSGTDFLSELGREWEAAADPARAAGIRVVHPRMGIVLSPGGGALSKLLLPFRLGVGGRLGSGRQWMSWIAIDDALAGLRHCLADERLSGPVNLTAPQPVTNREFTKALAQVLRRPSLFPVPAFVLQAMFGDMAEATLLASQRAVPARLESVGFQFRYPDIRSALRHVLPTIDTP